MTTCIHQNDLRSFAHDRRLPAFLDEGRQVAMQRCANMECPMRKDCDRYAPWSLETVIYAPDRNGVCAHFEPRHHIREKRNGNSNRPE